MELWQDDGLRGGDLAERLGVEPPTVTKMLRRLGALRPRGAEGWTRRTPGASASISQRKGGPSKGPSVRCWERAEQTVLAGINARDRQTFRRLLIRVKSNLDPEFGAGQ